MEEFEFINQDILKVIMNGALNKEFKKINFRKIMIKNEEKYLIEKFTETQSFHQNIALSEIRPTVLSIFQDFKQMELFSLSNHYIVLKSKKNKITVIKKNLKEPLKIDMSHNKEKNYILKEREPIYPLIELGVFNDNFEIIKSNYDKYKQINKFIEFIDEVIRDNNDSYLNIVDFGCGKSYLTFIIYYYLTFIKKIECKITGIDLKEEVIHKCNEIKEKYGYSNLNFLCIDAKEFKTDEKIDMVISLHACDIITDYCLFNAIKWNAKYIFSVPCCQKELNKTIKNKDLDIMLKHGLVKERFSSLLTDSIRGEILNLKGYDVNLMEFVDLSHTPKNILIRAVKNNDKEIEKIDTIENILKQFKVKQTLFELIKKDNNKSI